MNNSLDITKKLVWGLAVIINNKFEIKNSIFQLLHV